MDAQLDRIEGIAADLERKLFDYVDNCLAVQQAFQAQVEGATAGMVEATLNRWGEVASRILSKIIKEVDRRLGNAYTYAFPLGATYPNDHQVATGLQTGDYLGTMQWPPAGDRGPAGVEVLDPLPNIDPGFHQPGGPGGQLPGHNPPPPMPPIWNPPPPGQEPPLPPPQPPPGGPPPGGPPQQPPPGGSGGYGGPGCAIPPLPSWAGPGWIPVDSCGNCPPGLVSNAATGTFFPVCVPPITFGGGGQPPPPLDGGCGIPPDAPKIIPPVRYDEANPPPAGDGTRVRPWQQLGTGEPPGSYQRWEITYWDAGTGSPVTLYVWLPRGMHLIIDTDGNYVGVNVIDPGSYVHSCTRKVGEPTWSGPHDEPPMPPNPGVCPAPETFACDPKGNWQPQIVKWDESDVCKQIQKALTDNYEALPNFSALFKWAHNNSKPGTIVSNILTAITGRNSPIMASIIDSLGAWLEDTAKKCGEGMKDCVGPAMPVVLTLACLKFLQQWTQIVPQPLLNTMESTLNSACQSVLPSGDAADAARLAATIDEKMWECWHKAQGNHTVEMSHVLRSKRTRPNVMQLSDLFRRKQISEEEFKGRCKEAGVMFDPDREILHKLTESWPQLADVIRFMVRDVADPKAVERGNLDQDFEAKWAEPLKSYGDALGVTPELAKLYWRAHWQIPSFTMLTEMLRRNRPDKVKPELVVTEENVRDALKQDDWSPGWVEKMIAVSYRTVTRTDALMMYQQHSITDEELHSFLMDEGYTSSDADVLLRGAKQRRKIDEIKRSGLPTSRALITRYARGEITWNDFADIAQRIAISEEQATEMQNSARLARDHRIKSELIKTNRKAFLAGLVDEGDVTGELAQGGLDLDAITELVDMWKNERNAREKMPGAAQLCKWRSLRLITADQQVRALRRLGWGRDHASNIASECDDKLQKEARAAAAKARAEQIKAIKDLAALKKLYDEILAQQQAAAGLNFAPALT